MSLISKLKTALNSKQSIYEQYVEILGRAETPEDGDAELLVGVLRSLGKSATDAADDTEAIKMLNQLAPNRIQQELQKQRTKDAEELVRLFVNQLTQQHI